MRPNEIREHLRTRPFQPFRVYMSDGASYDVRHPEMALVGAATLVIAKELGEEELPTRFAYLDPVHVTRVEPINGAGAKHP